MSNGQKRLSPNKQDRVVRANAERLLWLRKRVRIRSHPITGDLYLPSVRPITTLINNESLLVAKSGHLIAVRAITQAVFLKLLYIYF